MSASGQLGQATPEVEAGGSCFIPAYRAPDPAASGGQVSERVVDMHRAVRYDALLQLIGEIQRRRDIRDVAQVVASRWKHCANVGNWRLLCVYGEHASLLVANGTQVQEQPVALSSLAAYDQLQWERRLPKNFTGDALIAAQASLPPELADARGADLAVLPIQQGSNTIGMLSVVGFDKPFELLDRKFIAQVASAMTARIVAILTEQTLSADLLRTERELMSQRHASILGRLVNGVAHELNTPLGVQISACDGLAMLLEDREQVKDAVDDISRNGRACCPAGQTLRWHCAQAQATSASASTPAQATPLVDELSLLAASQLAQPDAPNIEVNGPDALSCTLDRNTLHTVVNELIDNVRAHAGKPGRPANLVIDVREADGRIEIVFADDGPGISSDMTAHYFDPFHTSKQSLGHIGIGGYIVQSLAQDVLSAQVTLDATPGAGVRVTLSLPRA